VQGKMHGKAVYTTASGDRNEGMFVDDNPRGTFEVRYPDRRVGQKEF
jgi:hypothetical protein